MENHTLIERLARHLAAAAPGEWQARIEDAASILAILKEPDAAMREAGDVGMWGAMIDAALRERWAIAQPAAEPNEFGGSDEEGEIRLTSDAVGHDRADWVHLHHGQEKDI
ncbi:MULTISPECIES: hypothetical protein [Sphingobium]|uniref:Uncharacterized protein n=2 Tax=Sphingobium cupriresistens TaxID=1132417 RepID=A0A0J7Y0V3_9SPHN|nr:MULTISPECIES: hypothetical protein [Sphingobium]KMS57511.1 hypothetical protein V473_04620 [Sphingobium cupriresistens LL01]MBJ7376326.1 hypothetical protein [Sphingobium sp.]RYM15081.1 hypothetical protein EWH12_00985 [Sphingobium cupriresistens]